MPGIKIRLIDINGEKRVPEEIMDLLHRYADHRRFCDRCERAYEDGTPDFHCHIGMDILQILASQPEVERAP